ncbi:APC family permease [Methanobacterium sp. BAmetb5]|uniref:APC family permease n=1 Tax=Methanobacterium sp. BAmetb5 TaxID=2025351 RepID=UPI0025FFC999|nr:APC family permease [Methanobacterium sp. BAmetb5]
MKNEASSKKAIGLWSAISIGIGGMIGAGIFAVLGIATNIVGNVVYLSFILGGMIALLSTYSYAKLSSKYPSAGGPVEFLIRGFGGGVLSGGFNFLLYLGYVFVLAVYAEAFGSYAATFLPPDLFKIGVDVFAILIIVIFTLINFVGPKAVGRSETLIVGIKVAILLIFAFIGFFFIKPALLSISAQPNLGNIFIGAALLFLGYEGFGLITNAAEDIEEPRKNIPRALYISVILVILIYLAVSVAVVGNLSIPEISKTADYALAAAAAPFAGSIGFTIMVLAALFSTSSAINATLYGGANVSYLMAKNGELPEVFNRKLWLEGKEGLLVTSVLIILLIFFLNLSSIAMMGSAAFLIIYAGVNFAHLKLYQDTGANKYIIYLAILGCLFSFLVLAYYEAYNSPLTLIVLCAAVLFSFLFEWIYRKFHPRT